jgi:hypothetical protein
MLGCPVYKNFEEIEEALSLDELTLMTQTLREDKHNFYRFLAALQGIDIDKNADNDDETFESIQRRALAKVKAQKEGKSVEEVEFEELGIAVIAE